MLHILERALDNPRAVRVTVEISQEGEDTKKVAFIKAAPAGSGGLPEGMFAFRRMVEQMLLAAEVAWCSVAVCYDFPYGDRADFYRFLHCFEESLGDPSVASMRLFSTVDADKGQTTWIRGATGGPHGFRVQMLEMMDSARPWRLVPAFLQGVARVGLDVTYSACPRPCG